MTKPPASIQLTAARMEAGLSNLNFAARQSADAMEAFAFQAHKAMDTEEFQQGAEVAQAALSVAAQKPPKA